MLGVRREVSCVQTLSARTRRPVFKCAVVLRCSPLQARENQEDEEGTLDSAVGSGSLAESTSLNIEVRSSDVSNATVSNTHTHTHTE